MVEVQSHESIARLKHGKKHGGIGLRARVGLDVGKLCSEEFFHSFTCQVLDLIYYLASTIVALAGKTLGVLVGEVAAHGCHHFVADKVF